MMDFFIKKIFEEKIDNEVHLQFQKFSRGNFEDRAMIRAKNSKGNYSVATTYEYANELVKGLGRKLGNEKTNVTGVIVSTLDLTGIISFSSIKQFMGIKQYVIGKEMSGSEIVSMIDKLPKAFAALSFTVNNTELKIKPKAPKSAKPSTKGQAKPKIDFCKIKTNDKEIVQGLLFDIEINSFKNIEVKHNFVIDEIIMPIGEKDPAQIREKAKRKGKIIRKIVVDGKEINNEKEFVA